MVLLQAVFVVPCSSHFLPRPQLLCFCFGGGCCCCSNVRHWLLAPPRMHLVMSQVCHSGTDGRFAEVAISVRLICTGLFSERSEGHLLAVQRQNSSRARGDRHQPINVVEHPTNVYGLGQTVTAYSKPLLASSIVTLKVLPCNCFSKSNRDLIESDNCKTVLSSSLE